MMLNFLKKKEPETKVIDKVVIDETGKLRVLLTQWENDKNTVFIFWFDESLRQAASYFTTQTNEPVTLLNSREAGTTQLAGKTAIFAEHYPVRGKEEELYQKMNLKTVQVFSSLKEPLFKRFGADKIIQLIRQMGMKEDEVIEHPMVSKAIRSAQEKIGKKVLIDQAAQSQSDWLKKNLVP